jgi:5-formyltetrahydrofolate cyclo-ligase
MIVPALAITTDGVRLGQGGGYYDRVLSLVRPDVPIIAMIYDHELLPAGAIPHEAHDVRVTHVCTPNDGLRAVKPASATP